MRGRKRRAGEADAPPRRSARGVLEALAGAGATVLLALLLARIAREKALALEGRAALGVGAREGARDAEAGMTDSSGAALAS